MGGRRARFDFERVDVFGVALDAVVVLDELAEELPDGGAYIRDQLRRAANSVAVNIAEGAGEFAPAEKICLRRRPVAEVVPLVVAGPTPSSAAGPASMAT